MCQRRQKLLAIVYCGPLHQGQLEEKMVKCEAFTKKDTKILAIVRDRSDWRGLHRSWESTIGNIGVPIRHGEVHD
jgi:hypothetical protein